jgi:hypothetical protein
MSEGGERRITEPGQRNLFRIERTEVIPEIDIMKSGDLVIFDVRGADGGETIIGWCDQVDFSAEDDSFFEGNVLLRVPREIGENPSSYPDLSHEQLQELLLRSALQLGDDMRFSTKPYRNDTKLINTANGDFTNGRLRGVRQILRSPSFEAYAKLRELGRGIQVQEHEIRDGREGEIRGILQQRTGRFIEDARRVLELAGNTLPSHDEYGITYIPLRNQGLPNQTIAGPAIAIERNLTVSHDFTTNKKIEKPSDRLSFVPVLHRVGFDATGQLVMSEETAEGYLHTTIQARRLHRKAQPEKVAYSRHDLGQEFEVSINDINDTHSGALDLDVAIAAGRATSQEIAKAIQEHVAETLGYGLRNPNQTY